MGIQIISISWDRNEAHAYISYTYDYSSRLDDHSKLERFEKRDIKALATGRAFGGYFNIRDRLVYRGIHYAGNYGINCGQGPVSI